MSVETGTYFESLGKGKQVWRVWSSCPCQRAREIESPHCLMRFGFVSVVGNDGFYVILKGWARPRTQMYKSLIEEDGPRTTFIPQSFHSYVCNEDLERVALTELELPPCGILVRSERAPPRKQRGVSVVKLYLQQISPHFFRES